MSSEVEIAVLRTQLENAREKIDQLYKHQENTYEKIDKISNKIDENNKEISKKIDENNDKMNLKIDSIDESVKESIRESLKPLTDNFKTVSDKVEDLVEIKHQGMGMKKAALFIKCPFI